MMHTSNVATFVYIVDNIPVCAGAVLGVLFQGTAVALNHGFIWAASASASEL